MTDLPPIHQAASLSHRAAHVLHERPVFDEHPKEAKGRIVAYIQGVREDGADAASAAPLGVKPAAGRAPVDGGSLLVWPGVTEFMPPAG